MKIPVNEPVISKEAKANVMSALESGWISSSGPYVAEFENAFAKYIGRKYGIAVSNGTTALHTALLSLGIGSGDEVIVPAFTMGASWLSVLHAGAVPVFVDCEMETWNIDPEKIEMKITGKTKAIMPVDIYGHPCDMDKITAIAKKYNLLIIEDSAEAHGATYKGKKCGNFGDIGCFSFYANKIITTGEGGMLLTDDEQTAREARKYRDLYHSESKRFIHEKIGYNYRLTNIQASIGLGELSHIDEYIEKKRTMAKLYDAGISDIEGLSTVKNNPNAENVYWMYGIVVDEKKFGMSRNELRKTLAENGVETRDFFYPPEDQPVLKNIIGAEKFPNAKYLGEHGLYLPSGLALTNEQIEYVIKTISATAFQK